MSEMKRYFEEHVHEIPDEVLLDMGYSKEDIELFRECLPGSEMKQNEESLG